MSKAQPKENYIQIDRKWKADNAEQTNVIFITCKNYFRYTRLHHDKIPLNPLPKLLFNLPQLPQLHHIHLERQR